MMFENTGEIVVLAMVVAVTWMAAWGIAEWRFTRYERSVRNYAPESPAQRTGAGSGDLAAVVGLGSRIDGAPGDVLSSTVRIIPAPHLPRTA